MMTIAVSETLEVAKRKVCRRVATIDFSPAFQGRVAGTTAIVRRVATTESNRHLPQVGGRSAIITRVRPRRKKGLWLNSAVATRRFIFWRSIPILERPG